ncbi:MAG: aminotransferase class V-fold PLP-dependent enzyme [Agarilytica sp.]
MSRVYPDIDPDGLLEFSVVFTDRSLNHMSQHFQKVMRDLNAMLTEVYKADVAVVVPGGGTYGMEAVARQFAHGKKCMVIRNGFFSFRWTQIFEAGSIPAQADVLKALQVGEDSQAPFAPAPIEDVEAYIEKEKPELVFAPHVETASGIILPDDYIQRVAAAVHKHGGMFVLDCIASGNIWVDMKALGVDILISAPQKGWSSTPCSALVMLNEKARAQVGQTESSSFACSLNKWLAIMDAYLNGGHAYHATMPTDSLTQLRDTMLLLKEEGLEKFKDAQWELGKKVRAVLESNGFKSVAAEGCQAPGVIVSYADRPSMELVKAFLAEGLQTAAGVPLQCDEPADFQSFRIGLFGVDKLRNVDQTVENFSKALAAVK